MSLGGRLCLSSSQGTNLTVTELNRLHGGLNFGGGGGRRRKRQLDSFSSSNSNRSSFGVNGIGDHQCSSGRRGGGTGGHIAASTRITNSSSNPLARPFLSLKHRTSLQTHSVSRLFLQDKDYYYTRLGSHLYSAESSEIVTNITPVVESAAAAAADLEEQEVEEVVEKSVATSTTTRVTGDTPLGQPGGKVGIVNYYNKGQEELHFDEGLPAAAPAYDTRKDWSSRLWVVGPLLLVLSVVGPPLYLRKIFEAILEDSLVTDFVILFFTEILFYVGISLFLFIAHKIQVQQAPAWASVYGGKLSSQRNNLVGYRVSMIISVALGVVLPAVSFAVVWPWTGPAAAAALLPYLVGLAVQLVCEKVVQSKQSPVWPLVPITFQVYRLHQLNRAAQLVAGLLFSLKGLEVTVETMTINGSLQTLLSVLQLLGILCLWSLGAFLIQHFPSWPQREPSISIP